MFFYVSENSNGFFWILFAFILLNFLLTIFMGSKRRSPGPIPMPEEPEDYDYSTNEGAGAAGGLGYALMQYLNADCRPGTELLLDTIHFDYCR